MYLCMTDDNRVSDTSISSYFHHVRFTHLFLSVTWVDCKERELLKKKYSCKRRSVWYKMITIKCAKKYAWKNLMTGYRCWCNLCSGDHCFLTLVNIPLTLSLTFYFLNIFRGYGMVILLFVSFSHISIYKGEKKFTFNIGKTSLSYEWLVYDFWHLFSLTSQNHHDNHITFTRLPRYFIISFTLFLHWVFNVTALFLILVTSGETETGQRDRWHVISRKDRQVRKKLTE